MGVDVGRTFVGYATGDEQSEVVTPQEVLPRAKNFAEKQILAMNESSGPFDGIVFGIPLNEDGERTSQCEDVERFARRIERRSRLPIYFQDEHLSSVSAKEHMIKAGQNASIREDAYAAAIILRDFFAMHKKRKN